MAETEVETILREIRERVLAEQGPAEDASVSRPPLANDGNGSVDAALASNNDRPLATEQLSLVKSYLTTTARTWDRLPPLVSNRSGGSARLELWLKRQLKRATHWYTWEQVNFNAAAHHALRDLLVALSAQHAELGRLRAQLDKAEARRTELEQQLEQQLEQYQARLTMQLATLRAELRSEFETQLEALERADDGRNNEVDARFAALTNELREREARILEEQRVCFRQLALETSEAAVLEDRARRKTEALLEELQRRVAELEKESPN
jgi:hypothetical protein